MKTPAQIVLEMTSPIPPIEGAERFFDRNQRLIDRAEKLIAEAMLEAFRQGCEQCKIAASESNLSSGREHDLVAKKIKIVSDSARADRNGIYSP